MTDTGLGSREAARRVTMLRVPARVNAGLGEPRVEGSHDVTDMAVPPVLLDTTGALAPGAIAVLADSAIGFSVVTGAGRAPGMATSHLHLEFTRPVPRGTTPLHCRSRLAHVDGSYGLGAGTIELSDGTEVARATVGAVLLEPRPVRPTDRPGPDPSARTDPSAQTPTAPRHHLGGGVDEFLGTEVIAAGDGRCVCRFVASNDVTNSNDGVHGGIGVLMGERTMDRAVRANIDADAFRMVELRATYPRPIASNGERVDCHAEVVHRGRTLTLARAVLHDQRGRPAVIVDGTYVNAGRVNSEK